MQQPRPPAAVPLHPQPVVPLLWRPTFEAGVASAFKHETGDHGWGNNEIQNYTASPENSFIGPQPEAALILRAIASHDGRSFTSARLVSHQKMAWPRGHVEARISTPLASASSCVSTGLVGGTSDPVASRLRRLPAVLHSALTSQRASGRPFGSSPSRTCAGPTMARSTYSRRGAGAPRMAPACTGATSPRRTGTSTA